MMRSHSLALFVGFALLGGTALAGLGCTEDVACSANCGGGPTSSSATTPTSSTASSSNMQGTGTGTPSTGSSVPGSTSATMGSLTEFPPCGPLADDFDLYFADSDFQMLGEGPGAPWAELGFDASAVEWVVPGAVTTIVEQGAPAYLYAKTPVSLVNGPCALSARLLDAGTGTSTFGFVDAVPSSADTATISCAGDGAGHCSLVAFGSAVGEVTPPVGLAIAVDDSFVTALWDVGGTWIRIPGSPHLGKAASTSGSAVPVMAKNTGDSALWDDFGVARIPITAAQ